MIYYGPFAGLKIPENVFKVLFITEILGFYESCLHPIITKLLNRKPKNIILVGGSNGYYAAGFNYLYNPIKITIYETSEAAHKNIKSWFDINNLTNFEILGEANTENFKNHSNDVDFMLVDCEGFEQHLLDPSKFTWQNNTDIIVELHHFYVHRIQSMIVERFHKTHEIQIIFEDLFEDEKIIKILKGMKLDLKFDRMPNHRWIFENGNKVYTTGVFMYLKPKNV